MMKSKYIINRTGRPAIFPTVSRSYLPSQSLNLNTNSATTNNTNQAAIQYSAKFITLNEKTEKTTTNTLLKSTNLIKDTKTGQVYQLIPLKVQRTTPSPVFNIASINARTLQSDANMLDFISQVSASKVALDIVAIQEVHRPTSGQIKVQPYDEKLKE